MLLHYLGKLNIQIFFETQCRYRSTLNQSLRATSTMVIDAPAGNAMAARHRWVSSAAEMLSAVHRCTLMPTGTVRNSLQATHKSQYTRNHRAWMTYSSVTQNHQPLSSITSSSEMFIWLPTQMCVTHSMLNSHHGLRLGLALHSSCINVIRSQNTYTNLQ